MRKIILRQKGTVLIISFLVLEILLLLGAYFLTFTLTESKISKSQQAGTKAYYLSEAGVNEAIWKLKNDHTTVDGDPAWADDFIDPLQNPLNGPFWQSAFTRSFGDGTYNVSIQNSWRGTGDIISTSAIPIGDGKYAQRIVKVSVFRALGDATWGSAMFTGGASGNMFISSSNVVINKGNIFSGNILNISSSDIVATDDLDTGDLEGQILSNGNTLVNSSTITAEAQCAKNICTEECAGFQPGSCPPDSVDVPLVDFDSPEPTSFKSRAQSAQNLNQCQVLCNNVPCSTKCVFTQNQFANLLSTLPLGGTLTINSKITYVTGTVNISSRNLVVNGSLAVDKDISASSSAVTVNRPDAQSASGLIAGRKINFSSSTLNMAGIIYSGDQMNILSTFVNITGAIIDRKLDVSSSDLTITMDNDIVLYGLGHIINGLPINPTYSPIITVDHWEETY